jgi:hypothetical protein
VAPRQAVPPKRHYAKFPEVFAKSSRSTAPGSGRSGPVRLLIVDPAGDQVVINVVSDGKRPTSAKSFGSSGTFPSGTGKYAGISGGLTCVDHGPEFRTGAEGTYA